MNIRQMVRILKEQYSLSELEERLGLDPEDLEEGYEYFIDNNYDDVLEMLREDLYFG